MGLIAERLNAERQYLRVLSEGIETFTLPAGYYVVAYLIDGDPDQSKASKLTIAWANAHKSDIEVIQSYLADTVRFAGIRTKKDLPYPVEGKWLCIANATTVQDPIAVYEGCTRKDTAQAEALNQIAIDKANAAQGTAEEAAKLSIAAAKGAEHALSESGSKWLPWAIGGTIGVVGLYALAKLIRG